MKFRYILFSIIVVIVSLSLLLYFSIRNANIEYKYGEFTKMYHQYDSNKNYFVVVNNKEVGFLIKYGDVLLVDQNKCLTHFTDYVSDAVVVYQYEPEETFVNFTFKDAEKLKELKSTQLIFKKK